MQSTSRWLLEAARQVRRGKHVLLHGNVRDLVLVDGEFLPLGDALDSVLSHIGFTLRVRYNVADGVQFVADDMRERFDALRREGEPPAPAAGAAYRPPVSNTRPPQQPAPAGPAAVYLKLPDVALPALRTVLSRSKKEPCSAVFEFSDKLVPGGENQAAGERELLVLLGLVVAEAHRHSRGTLAGVRNTLVLLAPVLGQVPAWLYRDNPFIQVIAVGRPDITERSEYFNQQYMNFFAAKAGKPPAPLTQMFSDLTDGLSLWDLEALRLTSHHESLPVSHLGPLVDFFKHGTKEDPWEKLSLERIREAPKLLSSRVIGQSEPIQAVLNVLVSARGGVQVEGAGRRSARPKGVLFFVGPTGVGKTELAKATAELVFGDERAFARYDMSEYAQEHAAERLTGAPPSYVGYEAGGQLTNRMKERPFSLILFDEIEKAHPRVMDKFLQVLDDGRLTDGQGETVYFSHSLIIFTSNIGSTHVERTSDGRETVVSALRAELSYKDLLLHYRQQVRDHFIRLGRPEILGRIGEENIVVFDMLRPEHVQSILDKFLTGLAGSARERYGVDLSYDSSLKQATSDFCARPDNTMLGGRGIRNFVVSQVVPVLNTTLLANPSGRRSLTVRHDGQRVVIT